MNDATSNTNPVAHVEDAGRGEALRALNHASESFDAIMDLMNALVFQDIKTDTAERAIRALAQSGGAACEAAERALGTPGTGLFADDREGGK